MTLSLTTNIASLRAQQSLGEVNQSLAQVFSRLSSGTRIQRASDDVGGFLISSRLNTESRVLGRGVQNVNDAISFFNVADDSIATLNQILFRQQELAEQAANGLLSTSQRSSLNQEFVALQEEYNRVLTGAEFNGITLFSAENGLMSVQSGGEGVGIRYRQAGSTLESLGNYSTQSFALSAEDYNMSGVLAQDLNGDGIEDLVVVSVFGANGGGDFEIGARTFLGNSSGTYSLESSGSNLVSLGAGSFFGLYSLNMNFSGNDNEIIVTTQVEDGFGPVDFDYTVAIDNTGQIDGFAGSAESAGDAALSSVPIDMNGDGFQDLAEITGDTLLTISTQNTIEIMGFTSLRQSETIDVLTQASAQSALTELAELRSTLDDTRNQIAAAQSRIGSTLNSLQEGASQSSEASSRITSADYAQEVAELTRLSIIQSAGVGVLAQANQQPGLVAALIDG